MDINSALNLFKIRIFGCFCDVTTTISGQIHMRTTEKSASAFSSHHVAAATKSANQHTPVAPGQPPDIQAAAPNQLPASTTRQQHQISISFQLPPPDSSIKSASASSFHHQAAAPNQHQLPRPDSSTTSASCQHGNQPTSC